MSRHTDLAGGPTAGAIGIRRDRRADDPFPPHVRNRTESRSAGTRARPVARSSSCPTGVNPRPARAGLPADSQGLFVVDNVDVRLAFDSPMMPSGVAISVRDLDFVYDTPSGPLGVLHGISFDISAGDVVAITGVVGFGQDDAAVGARRPRPPQRGTVVVGGEDLGATGPR